MSRLIKLVIVAVITVGLFTAGILGYDYYQHTPTADVPVREYAAYEALIAKTLPIMTDSNHKPLFSVSATERVLDNWTFVTVTSNQTGDTLRALIYEPTRSTDDMRVVLAPTKAMTPLERLGERIDIPTEVVQKMEVKADMSQFIDQPYTASTEGTSAQSSNSRQNKANWSSPIANGGAISLGWHQAGSKGLHKGIDMPAPVGTPISAAHDGSVSLIYDTGACGWVTIITAAGLDSTFHAYQNMTPSVKLGDEVTRGQVIGSLGAFCGNEPHLHFSIETANRISTYADTDANDTSRNPKDYLP